MSCTVLLCVQYSTYSLSTTIGGDADLIFLHQGKSSEKDWVALAFGWRSPGLGVGIGISIAGSVSSQVQDPG